MCKPKLNLTTYYGSYKLSSYNYLHFNNIQSSYFITSTIKPHLKKN